MDGRGLWWIGGGKELNTIEFKGIIIPDLPFILTCDGGNFGLFQLLRRVWQEWPVREAAPFAS